MSEFVGAVQVVGMVAGTLIAVATLTGLATKFVLLPWIRSELNPIAEKVTETHRQVTVNGHQNAPSLTIKDHMNDIARELEQIRQDQKTLAAVFDAHIRWAEKYRASRWIRWW